MSILKDKLEPPATPPSTDHPWLIQNGNISKEQAKLLHEMSVYISVPMYGGRCEGPFAGAMTDLIANFTRLGMAYGRQFLYNESLVQRARNTLVGMFERSKHEWMLFIDADVSFTASNLLEMLLAAKLTGAKLIGASYPMKTINWEGIRKAIAAGVPDAGLWHCAGKHFVRFMHDQTIIKDPLAPVECKYLGTGFMMIHNSVYDAIRKTEWAYRYNSGNMPGLSAAETIYAYFDCKIDETHEYLSEDYLFSKRCLDVNIQPWLCPWIHLQHTGTITFDGCLLCSSGVYVHNLGIPKKEEPK